MPEEIKEYVKPIMIIPPQSLLHAELYQLRQKAKRMSKTESLQANKFQQQQVIDKLVAMGRSDLTK